MRDDPLTVKVLSSLVVAPGASFDIAAELDVDWKDVAGTLSNMRRQGYVDIVRKVSRTRGYAFLYSITPLGEGRIAQHRRLHPA